MHHESQANRLRSQRPDTQPEPAEPNAQVRLQERQALPELPRDQWRKRPPHQGGSRILPSDIGRQRPVRYFSTFSGIGGFELGIERARSRKSAKGKSTEREDLRNGRRFANHSFRTQGNGTDLAHCVGYSEIDKYAAQIYQSHFPTHRNCGDITTIDAGALPDFDLYVGGFPCQAFSIAGKRGGFNDTRGTLFFDVARLLKAKQPRHFLLENVKGLLSHDDGRTFKTIIATLAQLGYGVEWQVLNSKDFGVLQNRERVFIVGHLGGECARQVFPLRTNGGENSQAIGPAEQGTQGIATRHLGRNEALTSPIASTVQVAEIPHIAIGTLRTHKDGEGFREVQSGLAPTIPARAREDGSGQGVIRRGMEIRRLTPTECERLQGFPDGWTEGISDTQRYKTLGNAVTVNVIEAVISAMYN
jgi:DNA (cytosine-5)-methyltransferase 1